MRALHRRGPSRGTASSARQPWSCPSIRPTWNAGWPPRACGSAARSSSASSSRRRSSSCGSRSTGASSCSRSIRSATGPARSDPSCPRATGRALRGSTSIGPRQLRHSVRWRRALDLGFPNTFDRAFRRTGSDVLVHGGCTSTGCYAMTDPVIEEIFRLSREALADGQKRIHVHAFPFRMTAENLAANAGSEWHRFWSNLKDAYDALRKHPPPAGGERLQQSVCRRRRPPLTTTIAARMSALPICAADVSRTAAPDTSVVQAYAAARRARLAAGVRHRQALHAGSQRRFAK